jgi:hypothetical protein
MRRTLTPTLCFCAILAAGGVARAADPGPQSPSARTPSSGGLELGDSPYGAPPPIGADLVLQMRLQTSGKAVLAAALALIVAGVTLIEIDPYALAVGDWGFATIGVGLGAFITSAFLLGFSHPVHVRDHPALRKHRFGLAPIRGLAFGYARAF